MLKIIFVVTYFLVYSFLNYFDDKVRYKDSGIPKITRGSVIMDHEIKGKGRAVYFTWNDGSFGVARIDSYSTTYMCYYLNGDGSLDYIGTSELYFGPNSPYKKWFPFEVKDYKDFIDNYDYILDVVKKLPINDSSNKSLDSNYTFQIKTKYLKKAYCDLTLPKI